MTELSSTDALNAELTDDQISDAIAREGGDGDHPDGISVAKIRDTLTFIAESGQAVWNTWMDNIEDTETVVVAETDTLIIVDTGSHNVVSAELDAMESDGELPVSNTNKPIVATIITSLVHEIAREHSDRDWSVSYPWVLVKPDDGNDRQAYVEATVNGLIAQGLSPGQAWAYYGVEIRGESQSAWARRQDRQQQQVSKALRTARQKAF